MKTGKRTTGAKAIDWLYANHKESYSHASIAALESLGENFASEINKCGSQIRMWIDQNLNEFLIADGFDFESYLDGKEPNYFIDLLLNQKEDIFTGEDRKFLLELKTNGLALYEVTGVDPNANLVTICNALNKEAQYIEVTEHKGSKQMQPGLCLGARIVKIDGITQFSGAIYPFSPHEGADVAKAIKNLTESLGDVDKRHENHLVGLMIFSIWLQKMVKGLSAQIPVNITKASIDPALVTIKNGEISLSNEQALSLFEKLYDGWEHEKIPMLGNISPIEAIQTEPGLERVKGLLRMMANQPADPKMNRPKSNYAFLWHKLGLELE